MVGGVSATLVKETAVDDGDCAWMAPNAPLIALSMAIVVGSAAVGAFDRLRKNVHLLHDCSNLGIRGDYGSRRTGLCYWRQGRSLFPMERVPRRSDCC